MEIEEKAKEIIEEFDGNFQIELVETLLDMGFSLDQSVRLIEEYEEQRKGYGNRRKTKNI